MRTVLLTLAEARDTLDLVSAGRDGSGYRALAPLGLDCEASKLLLSRAV
jgi:hypothetical protein